MMGTMFSEISGLASVNDASRGVSHSALKGQTLSAALPEIRLSNLAPEVRDLFSYTNLDSMFRIDTHQEESLESFGASE